MKRAGICYGVMVLLFTCAGPILGQNVDVQYSTYLGGSAQYQRARGIAVDSSACAYITGNTNCSDFPTVNPYQPGHSGGYSTNDVFVTKLFSSGSALAYSTYLGGGGDDGGASIAVDSSGSAYVTGWTYSTDNFPTVNGYQPSSLEESGESDGFLTKFSSSGSSLVFSTYLGGRYNDYGNGVAVGSDSTAYVVGITISDDFPTQNPYQASWHEGYSAPYGFYTWDLFITRFSSAGDSLIFSTYFGGVFWDSGADIDLDLSGNAYVTGWTESTLDFPIMGAYQSTYPGNGDETAFVSKFAAAGNSLYYSTFLGGSSSGRGRGIGVDSAGSAYVSGATGSSDFPIVNPYQATPNSSYPIFISKLTNSGTGLIYSTFLGGSGGVQLQDGNLVVDSSLRAYIAGSTGDTDFPTVNPYQSSNAGFSDIVISSLSSSGSSLEYSTYLGGASNQDYCWGIAVDDDGNAYVTGYTNSDDFPTRNPYQATKVISSGAYAEPFVTKLGFGSSATTPPWIYDYNGDGTSDIAVYRGTSGLWAIRGMTRVYFGGTGDEPVPADYNGDGTTDVGIYRSTSGLWAVRGVTRTYFGGSSDIPEPGDYDGDEMDDLGVFRASTGLWAIQGVTRIYFGSSADDPLPGYYDGDGTKDIGLFRPSSGLWALRGVTRLYFGGSTDELVPGDYNGDAIWEPGIFRASSGLWAIFGVTRTYFGGSTDWALPADYDGNGIDDIGIFRESSALWAVNGITRTYFGSSGDVPVTR